MALAGSLGGAVARAFAKEGAKSISCRPYHGST